MHVFHGEEIMLLISNYLLRIRKIEYVQTSFFQQKMTIQCIIAATMTECIEYGNWSMYN